MDPHDASVLECIEIEKEDGISLARLKQVRHSVGAERDQWRCAVQPEVQSLRGNETVEVVPKSELRIAKFSDILPVRLVTGTKRGALAGTERKQGRGQSCAGTSRTSPPEKICTPRARTSRPFARSSPPACRASVPSM